MILAIKMDANGSSQFLFFKTSAIQSILSRQLLKPYGTNVTSTPNPKLNAQQLAPSTTDGILSQLENTTVLQETKPPILLSLLNALTLMKLPVPTIANGELDFKSLKMNKFQSVCHYSRTTSVIHQLI